VTSERLSLVALQLEEKEKSLMAAEAEVNALNRNTVFPMMQCKNNIIIVVSYHCYEKITYFPLMMLRSLLFFGLFNGKKR
jgi:hypothetical protein